MTAETKKTRARSKILGLLSAKALQGLSSFANPHLADRETLEAHILAGWDGKRNAIRQAVISIFNEAG